VIVISAPVGHLLAWAPPPAEVPVDWIRCQGQPVVEYPCLDLVIEAVDSPILDALGFVETPAGRRLPDRPAYIIRARP
jgi:hypothetical protein